MSSLIRKKQRHGHLVARSRTLLDAAEHAGRDLNAAESREFDDLSVELDELKRDINAIEREHQLDRGRAGTAAPPPGAGNEELRSFLAGEIRSIDLTVPRSGERVLQVGTATAGGASVPQDFVGRLYEHLIEASAIRRTNVQVLRTDSGVDMPYPVTTDHGSASISGEGTAITEDDPEFDSVTLKAWKYGQLIKVNRELLEDTGVDLEGYLSRAGGRAIGQAFGAHCIVGNGTSQPQGVSGAVTTGQTAAAVDEVTAEELKGLYFGVIDPYRRNGYWLMNDATWAHVSGLTDSTGRFLIGDLERGASPRLLGRDVVLDPSMPAMGADANAILFGDFNGYVIREAGVMRIERSDDYEFDQDRVAFRFLWRLDGRLVDASGAIKALTMAAA